VRLLKFSADVVKLQQGYWHTWLFLDPCAQLVKYIIYALN